MADPVVALDDQVGLGEAGLDVALADLVVRRRRWVEASGSKTGGSGSVRRRMRRLASRSVSRSGAASSATGSAWWRISPPTEGRLVVLDEADDVLAGDVRGGHDDDPRPVEVGVEVDAEQAGVGLGRADGGAVPGAREDEVVGVAGQAGQLVRALATERRRARSAEAQLTRAGHPEGVGRQRVRRCRGTGPGRDRHPGRRSLG